MLCEVVAEPLTSICLSAAFALPFLRFREGFSVPSGEDEPEAALAAIVFLRQSALLKAACDRIALLRSPF